MSVVSPGPAGLEEALKVWLTTSRKGLYINTPRGKGVEFEEGVTPHDDDDIMFSFSSSLSFDSAP